jgi:hypothetical protein
MSGFKLGRMRLSAFEPYYSMDRRDDLGLPDRYDVITEWLTTELVLLALAC